MTTPALGWVDFGGPPSAPLMVLGPSLGTSVTAVWSAAAQLLTARHQVIGFDLPGHGCSPSPREPFSIADLAAAVNATATARGAGHYHYAGVSAGGAVGLELLLRHGDAILSAALICTGARIRTPEAWMERARVVRSEGTAVMLDSAPATWYAEGFADRDRQTATALLQSLRDIDAEGYAATCEALARFDVRNRLSAIVGHVLAIAGSEDIATPPQLLLDLADRIPRCRYLEVAQAAHLAPAEQPVLIADELFANTQRSTP